MELQKVAVILLTDLVAGKDDHILRIISLNKGNVLVNRIGRSLIPIRTACFLIRRQDMNTTVQTVQIPGLSVSDIFIQHQRLILGKDTYRINS